MEGIKDLSMIERLKLLKSIRLGCSSESDFDTYLDLYSGKLTKLEAKRRVEGLLLEDEFLLLCKIMRGCHLINGIDQGLSIDNGLKVPDYLVVFDTRQCLYDPDSTLDAYSSLVEVKTTNNFETKKLGAGFVKKYSAYAEYLNLPLTIASRLKLNDRQQWWVIQTKEQFIENGRKTDVECLTNSIGHILLNDCFISATQDIYIDLKFSNESDVSNIYDPKHGYLKCVTIRSDGSTITLKREHFFLNLFLDCFAQKEVSINKSSNEIIVSRVIDIMQSQLLSDILLRANFSILDDNGAKYTSASRLLALLENGKASIVYRDFIEKALSYFNSEVIIFMITKIGDDSTNNKLVRSLLSNG